MAFFSYRQRASRDAAFPLTRRQRWYTTDLRFMARPMSRVRRAIAVYEFSGVDHRERQLWTRVASVSGWPAAVRAIETVRHNPPAAAHTPTDDVLDLREAFHEPGMAPTGETGRT